MALLCNFCCLGIVLLLDISFTAADTVVIGVISQSLIIFCRCCCSIEQCRNLNKQDAVDHT